MTTLLPEPPPDARHSDAQLHGRACISCGNGGDLVPAGHVRQPLGNGEYLTWAVAAHLEHLGDGS